jgi:hypothetical protein
LRRIFILIRSAILSLPLSLSLCSLFNKLLCFYLQKKKTCEMIPPPIRLAFSHRCVHVRVQNVKQAASYATLIRIHGYTSGFAKNEIVLEYQIWIGSSASFFFESS